MSTIRRPNGPCFSASASILFRISWLPMAGVPGRKNTSMLDGVCPISSHSFIQRERTSSGFSPAKNSTRLFTSSLPSRLRPSATCAATRMTTQVLPEPVGPVSE